MEETVSEQKNSHANSKTVVVTVNNHQVVFQDHKATGLEIKRTAIQQGVNIQEDFLLFQVRGGGKLDPIADNAIVTLNKNDEFRATAADDNS